MKVLWNRLWKIILDLEALPNFLACNSGSPSATFFSTVFHTHIYSSLFALHSLIWRSCLANWQVNKCSTGSIGGKKNPGNPIRKWGLSLNWEKKSRLINASYQNWLSSQLTNYNSTCLHWKANKSVPCFQKSQLSAKTDSEKKPLFSPIRMGIALSEERLPFLLL